MTSDRAVAIAAINKTIGERLHALMSYRSVTRVQLAEQMGATSWKISRFVTGASGMTAADLVLAARALDVTSANITGETPLQKAI